MNRRYKNLNTDNNSTDIKEKLFNVFNEEVKLEIENLKLKNKDLAKKNFQLNMKINKLNNIIHDYENNIDSIKKELEKKRFSDLIGRHKTVLYKIEKKELYKKKCDKCNEYREVKVTLPSGKVIYDACCDCGISKTFYYPEACELYSFQDGKDYNSTYFYYKANSDSDYFSLNKQISDDYIDLLDRMDLTGLDIDDILDKNSYYNLYFTTLEKCEDCCKILNKDYNEENKEEYKYNKY